MPRSTKSPWGNFKGTWDLPNKITREIGTLITFNKVLVVNHFNCYTANQLSAPDPDKIESWYKRYAKSRSKLPLVRIHEPESLRKLVRESKYSTNRKSETTEQEKKAAEAIQTEPRTQTDYKEPVRNDCICKVSKGEEKNMSEDHVHDDNLQKEKSPEDKIVEKVKTMKIA